MKRILSVFVLALLCATTVSSQNKKDVLLHINNEPVYSQEFKRVYLKNLDLVQEESQKDVDGYLELFIDYKLKIAEAKTQGLDQEKNYVRELSQYRNQLSQSYLYEDQITEDLAREAYERGKEEIRAAHILVLADPDTPAQDTLVAYNKIKALRDRVINGEDFETVAIKHSEEPGAFDTGGDLNYFTVFMMVYPFETAAYNTPVGEISEIVRSRFGYHIIKVKDRRKRMPQISVSHIMISDQGGARNFDPHERIKEIQTMLKQGQTFEDLAKEFSDDPGSGAKGGKLNPFTKGQLRAPEFEDAAYQLKNVGDISEPVKSAFGWHIIRLDEIFPEQSFEEQKLDLEKKVASGDRSKAVTYNSNKKIKEKYGFKEGAHYLPYFETYINDSILSRKWKMTPMPSSEDKVIFTVGKKDLKFSDFARFVEERQRLTRPFRDKAALLAILYEEFETHELKEYFKAQLEIENEDYAAVLSEYRDGLLIFDVMEKNIWERAKNDSIGLQAYYEKHKENYRWKQRLEVDVFSATSQATAQRVQNLLRDGKAAEEIKMELNPEGTVNVMLTQGTFEVEQSPLPKGLEVKKGVSTIYQSNGSFIVVNVKDILPEGIKDLDDVRGIMVSNYQSVLEKEWMDSLHSKYKVSVDEKSLKKLKKELKK